MGIELRDHVHEIEFLAIVAFVAREVQMSIPTKSPYTQFTPQDLEMAFAFQVKYGMCCIYRYVVWHVFHTWYVYIYIHSDIQYNTVYVLCSTVHVACIYIVFSCILLYFLVFSFQRSWECF